MANYDEDLTCNSFFQTLREDFREMLDIAIAEQWSICIPCQDSCNPDDVKQEDFANHVLVPLDGSRYRTLGNRNVTRVDKLTIRIELDHDALLESQVLFEETYYEESNKKIKLICLSLPLMIPTQQSDSNRQDPDHLKHRDDNGRLLAKVEEIVKDSNLVHTTADDEGKMNLLLEQFKALKKSVLEGEDDLNGKLSDFIHYHLIQCTDNKLSDMVTLWQSNKDADLNKMIRTYQNVNAEDLKVSQSLMNCLPRARQELESFSMKTDPDQKLKCLKNCFNSFQVSGSVISCDDILPAIIFVILKADNVHNWFGQLRFIDKFSISCSNDQDQEEKYVLATFLAALEFILSDKIEPHSDQVLEQFNALTEKKDFMEDLKSICDKDETGRSPLHFACLSANLIFLEKLLSLGQDMESQDLFQRTPLHYAAHSGNQNALLLLLYANSSQGINALDMDGNSPLHLASFFGHVHCVKALLFFNEHQSKSSLDINLQNKEGYTALHMASFAGFTDIVTVLLEHDARTDLKNVLNQVPSEIAQNSRLKELIEIEKKKY